jgi:hypothetical protein
VTFSVDLPADPASAGTVALVGQPAAPPPGPADPGGQGEDFGKSSPLGFLILILFFVAVAFLIRSMTKHLKRVPQSFDPPADDAPDSPPPAKA